MNILVVGKGGREHALVTSLVNSPGDHKIFSWPGSDAINEIATPISATNLSSLTGAMLGHKIDLCVAGEESWLVTDEGLNAACKSISVPCWGPPKESAQLEASKWFAKEFMTRHNIPTGSCVRTSTLEEAQKAITQLPVVLKFDGLAAGKGVAVCFDQSEVDEFLNEVFTENRFGSGDVLVEEFLSGPEISIFCSVSDYKYQILTPARDYKRIFDDDKGANTGGMGAVACRNLISNELLQEIEESTIKPTIEGLKKDGLSYTGFLYFGFILTDNGPKMLEYNCRFGDPECQAVLPLISGDFANYVKSGAEQNLNQDLITFSNDWSVCLILASHGYPESSRSGDQISGLSEVTEAQIFHAGTKQAEDGSFETNGGRVLAVVSQGKTREEAVKKAYNESTKVSFSGCQRRQDIGILHFEST